VDRLGRRRHLAGSNGRPGSFSDRPDDAKLAFVRICSHYFAHDCLIEGGVLIREAASWPASPPS
jgi:proline iminopeptidase